ncbi:MAG TPA: hypothetical protein VF543_15185 [Pyrinomonadaceae bacterium]
MEIPSAQPEITIAALEIGAVTPEITIVTVEIGPELYEIESKAAEMAILAIFRPIKAAVARVLS